MNISFQPLNPPWTEASSKALTMWAHERCCQMFKSWLRVFFILFFFFFYFYSELNPLLHVLWEIEDVYVTHAKLTSFRNKRKQASGREGDKERAQFTGHWSSRCDLFSILLLRLEYHPRDPLTGISDSVDTVVRSAPQHVTSQPANTQ